MPERRALALLTWPSSIGPRPRGHHGRDIDAVAAAIRHRGRGLIAAGGEHDAVERIAVKQFHEAEISEVAVERGVRALAGFLQRMNREFERDAAGIANAVADTLGKLEVMAVAGREVEAASARCR